MLIGADAAVGVQRGWINVGPAASAILALVAIAGFGGALTDSLLGATVQVVYRCPVCGAVTESPDHHIHTPLVAARGHVWATNDAVNALSTLAAALLAAGAIALGQ
jgi:uncharacterized membrane protein